MASAAPPPSSSPSGSPPGAVSPAPSPPTAAPPPLAGSVRHTGATRVPSVRALDWRARGFTKVVGDVEVGKGDVSGTLTVGGKLTAGQLDLSGDHRVDGEMRISGPFRARGTLHAGGAVTARTAALSGTMVIGGPLVVEDSLEWSGALEAGRDVRAGVVLFHGRLTVRGTLYARSISGEVDSLSSANEIRADWIEIRRRKPLLPAIPLLPPPPWHELKVQRVEATEVHLSGVRVHYLRADRIWLGPDAHVEYVEGTIVERHKDAHVGPESESPPPPGLNR